LKCGGIFDIANRRVILAELEKKAEAPGFWDSPNAARETIAQTNQQRAFTRPFEEFEKAIDDAATLLELAELEDGPEKQNAWNETEKILLHAGAIYQKLRLQSLLGGKLDACNAFVTIHSGAGGTESCDWADMLFRMYRMYCEDAGFEVEIMDSQPGDEAGLKSVTFSVAGGYAYGFLKAERGVHRLVRISPFDSAKRRHTSFCSLDVVAELDDDIDVEINEADLRIDTYRSGGAGGQHVNKTDSAIRITHLPTGIVVACQSERSQHKNKSKAFSILKAKLYELQMDKQRKEMERFYGEKGEIAWGSQIRSYVLQPYTMVKDHRTEHQTGNVQAVLDGALQPFIEAWLRMKAEEASATATSGA